MLRSIRLFTTCIALMVDSLLNIGTWWKALRLPPNGEIVTASSEPLQRSIPASVIFSALAGLNRQPACFFSRMAEQISTNTNSLSHLPLDSDPLAELKQAAEREIEMQASSASVRPYKRGRTFDSSRWYMGSLLTFLAEGNDTHGGFALLEIDSKHGNEPPPHVHGREDEFFYVLEGEMDGYVGREVFHAGPGECLFIPKGMPHGFVICPPRLRMLFLYSPAGAENYFRAMGSPAGKLEMPSDAVTYSQGTPEEAVRVAAELGTRFLSPDEIAEQMPAFPGRAAV